MQELDMLHQNHTQELQSVIQALAGIEAEENAGCFFTATQTSPITRQSLSELDIGSIINNSKLRHDINFDRELHFRPNLDGQKGLLKRQTQKAYWCAVEIELCLYKIFYGGVGSDYVPKDVDIDALKKKIQKRLPAMFETIKEIVINLVPERDQEAVKDRLDVPMLMQEIEKQLCDFVSISQGLASLLKRHCAPMRDNMVDGMVRKMQEGDASSIAAGLRDLFGVLEAMKLDVANHQIRHLRGLLIEDTINFESKYHQSRIIRRGIKLGPARAWYLRQPKQDFDDDFPHPLAGERELRPFVTGFVRLLLPNSREREPEIFALDSRRLRLLRNDLQDVHFLRICSEVFESLVKERSSVSALPPQAFVNLQNDLQDIFRAWSSPEFAHNTISMNNISLEIARHAARCLGQRQLSSDLIEDADSLLEQSRHDPFVIDEHASIIEQKLVEAILERITNERCLHLSPWDLFNALVPPTTSPNNVTSIAPTHPQLRALMNDIIRRITHIAILHWRTWARIVYLNEDVDPEDIQRSDDSDKDSLMAGLPKEGPTRNSTPANEEAGRLLAKVPNQAPATLDAQPPAGQLPEPTVQPSVSSDVPTYEP
jgi:hypothetical protein